MSAEREELAASAYVAIPRALFETFFGKLLDELQKLNRSAELIAAPNAPTCALCDFPESMHLPAEEIGANGAGHLYLPRVPLSIDPDQLCIFCSLPERDHRGLDEYSHRYDPG